MGAKDTSRAREVMMSRHVVIIGGGPAGLTACYELGKVGIPATVLEREAILGGIARTDAYKGFRFDIGGHRFFTKCKEVDDLWTEILGSEMLVRPRLSRIYYRNKFFQYPLKPMDALTKLGLFTSLAAVGSYLRWRAFPYKDERSLEQWVTNRFGRRLYEMFFRTYTEKVWGIPCTELSADWAAQRIKGLSLFEAIKNAFLAKPGETKIKTLIDQFRYPRLGPGMMWERAAVLAVERGQSVLTERAVTEVRHEHGRVVALVTQSPDGGVTEVEGTDFISSLPLRELIESMRPAAPESVIAAARALRYRDFLTVGLICDKADLFPDNWIYVHSPEVRLGRVQNFKNWSPELVPDPAKSCLGLEYFAFEGDELWTTPDDALIELGTLECSEIRLIERDMVEDGVVVRVQKAYPIYDGTYQRHLATIREWLATLGNLQCVGRNGQHRYNNMDHSMLTAMLAVRNVQGESHDVWSVNVDQEYHEESETASGEGEQPTRAV
jgi:protoporphyrinogen oxidase